MELSRTVPQMSVRKSSLFGSSGNYLLASAPMGLPALILHCFINFSNTFELPEGVLQKESYKRGIYIWLFFASYNRPRDIYHTERAMDFTPK